MLCFININMNSAKFSIVNLALSYPFYILSSRREAQNYICLNSFTLLFWVRSTNESSLMRSLGENQAIFLQLCCVQAVKIIYNVFSWLSGVLLEVTVMSIQLTSPVQTSLGLQIGKVGYSGKSLTMGLQVIDITRRNLPEIFVLQDILEKVFLILGSKTPKGCMISNS